MTFVKSVEVFGFGTKMCNRLRTAEMLARITTIPNSRKHPPSAESDGLSPELHDLLKNP